RSGPSTEYSERPSTRDARTAASMASLDSASVSMRAAVTTGRLRTASGNAHSAERPTSRSRQPRSATISVALGSRETIRRGAAIPERYLVRASAQRAEGGPDRLALVQEV